MISALCCAADLLRRGYLDGGVSHSPYVCAAGGPDQQAYPMMGRWCKRAIKDADIHAACVLHAHTAFLLRNVGDLTPQVVKSMLSSQVHAVPACWRCPGLSLPRRLVAILCSHPNNTATPQITLPNATLLLLSPDVIVPPCYRTCARGLGGSRGPNEAGPFNRGWSCHPPSLSAAGQVFLRVNYRFDLEADATEQRKRGGADRGLKQGLGQGDCGGGVLIAAQRYGTRTRRCTEHATALPRASTMHMQH